MIICYGLFPTVAFSAYFLAIFCVNIFGNQASLTNCSGTLIWLADSTASAPPARKNKRSFQRVSFQYYSHELSFLSFNFPWYFPEKSGTVCFVFRHISMDLFCLIFSVELSLLVILLFRWFMHLFSRHVSFTIQWIFYLFNLFVKLSNSYSFIYSYLYIRLFIRI